MAVLESGAILVYLAQKTKSQLLPVYARGFTTVMERLFFQMASVGPMFGQMITLTASRRRKSPTASIVIPMKPNAFWV